MMINDNMHNAFTQNPLERERTAFDFISHKQWKRRERERREQKRGEERERMKKIQSDRIQFWRPQGHTRTLFFLTLKNFLSLQSVVFFSLFLSLSRIQRGTGRRVLKLLQTVVCERRRTTIRRIDKTLKQKIKKKLN